MTEEVLKPRMGTKTPIVRISGKSAQVGAHFVGILVADKGDFAGKFPNNPQRIYEFKLVDIENAGPFVGEEEVDVKPGDIVTIFANGSLKSSMEQAKIGDKLDITYEGLQISPSTSKAFHKTLVKRVK